MEIQMTKTLATIIIETLIEDNNLSVNKDRMVKSYLGIYKNTKGDHTTKNENAKFLCLFYSHHYCV